MAKLTDAQKASQGYYSGLEDWEYGLTGFDPADYGSTPSYATDTRTNEERLAAEKARLGGIGTGGGSLATATPIAPNIIPGSTKTQGYTTTWMESIPGGVQENIPASMQPILPGQMSLGGGGGASVYNNYSTFRAAQLEASGKLASLSNAQRGITTTGGFAQPTAQVTYSKLAGGGAVPELAVPEWDENRIAQLRRKISGPAVRQLRRGLREALSATYENPNVRRMVVREALAGYGIGLGQALAQGEQAAVQQYGQEYSRQYQRAVDTYKAAMDAYTRESTQVQTTQKFYNDEELQNFLKSLEA